MQLLQTNKLSKHFGSRAVLMDVDLTILAQTRYGIVGANGAGKSTLVSILLSQDDDYHGSLAVRNDVRIAYVPQEYDGSLTGSVEDFLLGAVADLADPLREAEEGLAEDPDLWMDRYTERRERYDRFSVDDRIARIPSTLKELGLEGREDDRLEDLSGGERNLLALARGLWAKPDILVLDEPGNHLDFAGLELLESVLTSFEGAVLLVSHNRFLLDRVCQRILEVDATKVSEYTGNYSEYRRLRLSERLAQQASHDQAERRIARIEELVRRFREFAERTADPAWGQRYRAQKTKLEKEKNSQVDAPEGPARIMKLAFAGETSRSDVALEVHGYSKSFEDLHLLEDVSFRVGVGEKVALIGPNGCGKSTLIRDLIDHGDWDHSVFRIGPSQKVGYLSQTADQLDGTLSLEDTVRDRFPVSRDAAAGILRPLGFRFQDLEQLVGSLSGGERTRLQMALILADKPNLLILDEPTNHMDVAGREAVEDALDDFSGTVFTVSHDRYYLQKIPTRILAVVDRGLIDFEGGFTEFRLAYPGLWRPRASLAGTRVAQKSAPEPAGARRIEELEAERAELERQLVEAQATSSIREGRTISAKLAELSRRIDRAYEEWAG